MRNPSLPKPKNPQMFLATVWIEIDSDDGGVTKEVLKKHVEAALNHQLTEVADRLDRDEDPMPFAFHGAQIEWDTLRPCQ